jgi:hypothetical protein
MVTVFNLQLNVDNGIDSRKYLLFVRDERAIYDKSNSDNSGTLCLNTFSWQTFGSACR